MTDVDHDRLVIPADGTTPASAPLSLSELVTRVGDDHIRVQALLDVLVTITNIAKPRKRGASYHPGVRITFLTDQITPGEVLSGKPRMIPLVIWLPAERVAAARAARAAPAAAKVTEAAAPALRPTDYDPLEP